MWPKIKAFFAHSKTIFAARMYVLLGGLVALHDLAGPYVATADLTPITARLPAWAWPLISIGTGTLFELLRRITTQPIADQPITEKP